MCLRGASELNDELFAKNKSAALRGYVVWQPMAGGDRSDVPDATRIVADPRAIHYWDGPGATLRAYASVLGFSEPAWDVYMIYGPEARWDGALPPKPAFWMHQLGSEGHERVDGPYLDPAEFAAKAGEMLEARRIEATPRPARRAAAAVPFRPLAPGLAALRESFNAAVDHPRVLTLLSPT